MPLKHPQAYLINVRNVYRARKTPKKKYHLVIISSFHLLLILSFLEIYIFHYYARDRGTDILNLASKSKKFEGNQRVYVCFIKTGGVKNYCISRQSLISNFPSQFNL